MSPGSVDCYTGTTRSSPRCYVSCQSFEDQKATPRRPYECKITGKWNRPLPFCVTSGSGLKLAPAPKNLQLNQEQLKYDYDYFM
ncbi:uncharacterized protein TNIN_467331 [Trichonephila inaurata madagascariensis]|uniref:Sushi domain-containing protein n=1 Tax=Trichonephila inaurata madagascariensis TaxID=2747483 RepID=A0A8X6XN53_9ARAC|nr:uncharacterized protein TNIN_467331 [Trichonephila inaurata madagascariensis]